MMFHTFTAPGSTSAQIVSIIFKLLTNKYVGTNPPPKNIVMIKNIFNILRPTKSFFDKGYAASNVMDTEITANTVE